MSCGCVCCLNRRVDPALLDRRLVELIQAVDELRRQVEKLL